MTITQQAAMARGYGRNRKDRVADPLSAELGLGPLSRRSPLDLLQLLQDYCAEQAELLPLADGTLTERSYELLELTDELEIWAIHWPTDQGLELHDHGGSSGALWVIGGALEEHSIGERGATVHRRLEAGGGTAFGPRYIHDVVNANEAPATSVHVYSPPMASMTFYRPENGRLTVERAEYRADPAWAP
jgi:hypothetical protein